MTEDIHSSRYCRVLYGKNLCPFHEYDPFTDSEEEIKKKGYVEYKGFNFLSFITINFIITLGLTFLMIYGPKSFLFG